MFVFWGPLYDDSRTIRWDRTLVRLPGTSKERAWGTVSTRMTNSPPEMRLLIDVLAGFEVFGPLPSGFWYPGPDKGDNADLLCDCDTVIYRSVCPDLFCTLYESHNPLQCSCRVYSLSKRFDGDLGPMEQQLLLC